MKAHARRVHGAGTMSQQVKGTDPFFRAYEALRGELATAKRQPGSQIRVDKTAQELGISPTPVREALAMLAGERLVRGSRRQGYFVPQPSAVDLLELLTLSELYLATAIRLLSTPSGKARGGMVGEFDRDAGIAHLFMIILAGAGVATLLDSGALILERLATARLVDRPDVVERERLEIARLLEEGRLSALLKAVRAYHRLRRDSAMEIAQALSATSRGAGEYFRDMV